MKPDLLTPRGLFQRDIRYTIPEFQRPYVWNQEDQWEPLWDDVRNTAESYLNELDLSNNDSNEASIKATNSTPPHFFGAVVVQQVYTATRDIEQRKVIDGQQRVTTLQLLLDAVRLVCEEFELKGEAKRLSKFVTNSTDEDGDQVFKLWPTNTNNDIEAFRHAMHNGSATNDFENSLIVQAHQFFQLQTEEWLKANSNSHALQHLIEALETVVTDRLQMVVIDLEPQDDPHIIFETLNARGTPLLESDLIKNYVVSRANSTNEDDIWGKLGDNWWRKEIRQGRLRRPRIDMLLNYWLAMRTKNEVTASRVFNEFKKHAGDLKIKDVMSDVQRDLGNYRRFEEEPRTPDEDKFYYRVVDVMQTGVITPVLLLLLSVPLDRRRIKSLQALESFLIRRMVCRGTTKDYNRLTLELVGELQKQGLDQADSIVADFLKGQEADSRVWPDDEALGDSLATLPLYRLLTIGRLRLILEGIEDKLRTSSMPEQEECPKKLTIEHIMPQSWEAHWPLPENIDRSEGDNTRNQLIHTIGNLTLVTKRLNSSLSRSPWKDKRKTLRDHSTLFLNKRLLEESKGKMWDEQFIQSRSKHLTDLVAEVWPGPHSPVWKE